MPDSKGGGPIGTIARLRAIPSSIWALGFVSMLMDVSSESIHALLPIYLVTVLGASMQTVGLIEGVAGATASVARVLRPRPPITRATFGRPLGRKGRR